MFNDDFYPSPKEVKDLLLDGIRFNNKRILEPSAGKGDLISGMKCKIDVIEKENDLIALLQGKGYNLVSFDFLKYKTNTEYDYIIMNPPFSEGDKHLLHAIRLAENQISKQCEIRCILNAETIKNPYSNVRKELMMVLNLHNATIAYYDNLFTNAERKTNVETVVIKVVVDNVKNNINSLYEKIVNDVKSKDSNDDITNSLSTFVQKQELQERVENIELLIKKYEFHIELIKSLFEKQRSLEVLENELGSFNSYLDYNKDINVVIIDIRNKYWREILNAKEFADKLTANGREKLYKQIELSSNLEINIENVQMMLMAVIQNSNNMLMDSCVDLFERITKNHMNSFSSNIHYYNGWKTNNAYKINKKIILPFSGWSGVLEPTDMGERYFNTSGNIAYDYVNPNVKNFMTDLMRMLKLLDDNVKDEFNVIKLGEFENDTIRFKMFGKGTIHIWFKDLDLLERFNILCGQHFNWIPQDDEIKNNTEAKEFMNKEFKGYLNKLLD